MFFLILFVVLLCVLFVYFVLGSFVRYQGGIHHCPEVLPHYTVWCRLFRLFVRLVTCGRVNLAAAGSSFGNYYDRYNTSPIVEAYSYDEGWGVSAPLPSRPEKESANNLRAADDEDFDAVVVPSKQAA